MLPAPKKQHIYWMPLRGQNIKIIGAGMPRTGTNSFCAAVSHLVDGPSYHVGVQTAATGDENHVRSWISVLGTRPYRPEDKKHALEVLKHELDGYVMVTDPPVPQLVPELLELYPDAIVIVTMRDKKSWAVSFAKIIDLVQIDLLAIVFFWIRSLRLLPTLWHLFTAMNIERYGFIATANDEVLVRQWDAHMEMIKEQVPSEKLFFYDVREGWEPLCKILGKPVPKDMPFPRLNDSMAIEAAFKSWSIQGLTIWAGVTSVAVALVSVMGYLLWQRL
ncbi:hypothetical protein AMS68_002860 [Peltaster fructicola]|uniref:NAD dependent epimerase/dehydratase n=1 Tax=Peltaster fructicola TaxID=286661 RepID=A0A6H0XRL2_9PEZI|nr:hypothetical protein AMS68_002860 [Peltaster fructicola]